MPATLTPHTRPQAHPQQRGAVPPGVKARGRCRVYEAGISYAGRTYAEGKKIGWRDGVRALWCIAKYNWLRPATAGAAAVPRASRPAHAHLTPLAALPAVVR